MKLDQEKKTDFSPNWPTFILFGVLTALAFYYNIWSGIAGIIFGIFAALSFPHTEWNKKIKEWLMGLLYICLLLLFVFGLIWIGSKGLGLINSVGKYEGMTAEEWFNEYDETQSQIEDYQTALQEANDNIDEANSEIENVKSSSDIYELRDALINLSTVNNVEDPH